MNFFDPPTRAPTANEPLSLKRLGWSLSRGALLGAALAALLFAGSWAGALYETDGYDPWFWLVWAGIIGAFEFWAAAKVFESNKFAALLCRALAVVIGLGSVAYFINGALGMRPTELAQTQPEFVTLIAVCGIVGFIALRSALRLWVHHRSRVSLWFAAAVALWFSSEWAVRLGVVTDQWTDPRVDIAFNTMVLTGILAMVGALAFMDWHIRRQDTAGAAEAPPQKNGLNNG